MLTNSVNTTVKANTAADRCQKKNGGLISAFREFSELRERLKRNFGLIEDASEALTVDLFCRHQRLIKEILAIPASSIHDLKLKTAMLSSLLLDGQEFEAIRGVFQPFISDFDRAVVSLADLPFLTSDLDEVKILNRDNAGIKRSAIMIGFEEFITAWEGLGQMSKGSDSESDLEESFSLKVEHYWIKLEELVGLFGAISGTTLPEIITKRQVLEVCLTSGVRFSAVAELAQSFLLDWEQFVSRPEIRIFLTN